MPYSFSSSRVINTSLPIGLRQYWSIGVTSGDVGSGVADCDPQNNWNPQKNCGSFVDATTTLVFSITYRLSTDSKTRDLE